MADSLGFVIFIILLALIFDFLNGFHDSANAISTIVSTRVLTPRYAVLWAAFFEFAALFFVGVRVANTIGTGIINPAIVDNFLILAALTGAIIWNVITWYFGLPSSSSHALIGGLIGAGIVKGGAKVLVWSGITKTTLFIVLSPTLGFGLGFVLMSIVLNLCRNANVASADRIFRKLQLLSAAVYSMSHGTNDAQKTMGIIVALLVAAGMMSPDTHLSLTDPHTLWIILSCHAAMGIGTAFGGWRIVKTMGMKITKLRPYSGACAETAAAVSLFTSAKLGIPVSTTHTITGAIIGVGAIQRLSAVRWGIARRVIWAWVFTIPASAVMGVLAYWIIAAIRSAL